MKLLWKRSPELCSGRVTNISSATDGDLIELDGGRVNLAVDAADCEIGDTLAPGEGLELVVQPAPSVEEMGKASLAERKTKARKKKTKAGG
jgi:hypothetical protein